MTRNQIDYQKLLEDRRHNRATEQNAEAQLAETNRANVVRETETERSNRASESLKSETNVINQTHYARSDAETERSNRAREELERSNQAETHRTNVARERETNRANIANEDIRRVTNAINAAGLVENSRHNSMNETIQQAITAETNRSNLVNEKISQQRADTASAQAASSMAVDETVKRLNSAKVGLTAQQTKTQKAQQQLLEEKAKTEPVIRSTSAGNSIANLLGNTGRLATMLGGS